MDKTIKDTWVAELRSEKYKQGKARLHNIEHDTYCCLGVLCKTQNIEEVSGKFNFEDDEYKSTRVASLPKEYCHKINLTENQMIELIRLNDDGNKSFEEIATYIEENL